MERLPCCNSCRISTTSTGRGTRLNPSRGEVISEGARNSPLLLTLTLTPDPCSQHSPKSPARGVEPRTRGSFLTVPLGKLCGRDVGIGKKLPCSSSKTIRPSWGKHGRGANHLRLPGEHLPPRHSVRHQTGRCDRRRLAKTGAETVGELG